VGRSECECGAQQAKVRVLLVVRVIWAYISLSSSQRQGVFILMPPEARCFSLFPLSHFLLFSLALPTITGHWAFLSLPVLYKTFSLVFSMKFCVDLFSIS